MSGSVKLSEGSLETIMNGGTVVEPILQVLGSKKIASGLKDSERFRLLLSDGRFKVNIALYTVKLNDHQVPSPALEQYSVIKLNRFVSNIVKNKDRQDTRVLLILELELRVAGDEVGHEIGHPILLSEFGASTSSSQSSEITNEIQFSSISERIQHLSQTTIVAHITSLNPFHNNWVIKARVVNKTNIRNWSNAKGEGKLFSIDLVDKTGEIRCTAFRDLVDMFFDRLEVDKVYYISKCSLQPINRKYCSFKHNFEMTFTSESQVKESFEDNEAIPHLQYDLTTIDKVAVMETGTVVDVIGICKSATDLHAFFSKSTNRDLRKKEVILIDQSKTGIALTLWGNQAESFNPANNPVVFIKGAKILEFRGIKNIGLIMGSQMKINPDIPENQNLRHWYDTDGNQVEINNISTRNGFGGQAAWMTFKEVQARRLGDKVLYFQTLGTILFIGLDRAVYKSCPNGDCQKKVRDLENGMYRCIKCNREFPNFKFRLLISMNVSDTSCNHWMTAFSSEAEKIIGKSAQEIGDTIVRDRDSVAKLFEYAQFKQYVFKCRAKMETYNDERKLKIVVVAVKRLNHEKYNTYLISKVEKFRRNHPMFK